MPESNTLIQQPSDPVGDEELAILAAVGGEEAPEKAVTPEPEKAETPGDEEPAPEKDEVLAEDAAEKTDIDYGMKVPITGGEPVTLGELKDLWQNRQAATAELIERENTMLRAVEKSSELLNYVGELPPHVVQAAQAELASQHRQQAGILNEVLPETRTPDGIKAVRDALVELGAEYNLQPGDIDQIKHAITVKMMYDFARLKQSIKAAKENVKPLRSTSPAPARANINQSEAQLAAAKAKQTRNSQDEANAVAALLRSNAA